MKHLPFIIFLLLISISIYFSTIEKKITDVKSEKIEPKKEESIWEKYSQEKLDIPPVEREKLISQELEYLKNNVEEIEWIEVENNQIYIGFKSIPEDYESILRGASWRASRAIFYKVTVWGLPTWKYKKGWRLETAPPELDRYWSRYFGRYGRGVEFEEWSK